MNNIRPITILSIAGSDNSSGAGVQADLKTAKDLNAYCLNAITVVTSQNSTRFYKAFEIPNDIILSQIKTLIKEFRIDGIKIGLLTNKSLVISLIRILRTLKGVPIVVDPIFQSSTNKQFFSKSDYRYIYEKISRLNPIFTPNFYEFKTLLNTGSGKLDLIEDIIDCEAIKFKGKFIITGGDIDEKYSSDILIDSGRKYVFKSRKKNTCNTHGSGCCFSTALTVFLARGEEIKDAIRLSKKYINKIIGKSPKFGLRYGPIS